MTEPTTYQGSCHCGAVRYEVTMPRPEKAYQCNCSLCWRAGWLLTFVPESQFRLLSGEDSLRDYQFHKKLIHHLFCQTCGVRPFSRGINPKTEQMVMSVNLRCLAGFDTTGIPVRSFDGASL